MIFNPYNRFLRAEAGEQDAGGGGAASPAAENPAPAAQVVPVREPTLLEKAQASVMGKGVLLAENNTLKSQLQTLTGEKTALESQVSTLSAKVQELETERAAIAAALNTAEIEKQTVEGKAAQTVAALGFEHQSLPAATEQPAATASEIEAQLAKEADPVKRYELAAKLEKAV